VGTHTLFYLIFNSYEYDARAVFRKFHIPSTVVTESVKTFVLRGSVDVVCDFEKGRDCT
jgi:hypothetical protein